MTKSGRSVNKPAAFTPIVDQKPLADSGSPKIHLNFHSSSSRGATRGGRGRRSIQRQPELALCANCSRGHSPESNVIVFCDGCNTPWHQWCHDPHIAREVVEVAEKEWFCSSCAHVKEEERVPMDQRVAGNLWSDLNRRRYLDSLGSESLRALLFRALEIQPNIPIFPPRDLDPAKGVSNASGNDLARPERIVYASSDSNNVTANAAARELNGYAHSYPDIAAAAATNDPPATYPRPGNGPIKPKNTTSTEDVRWLLDDENGFGVFSHFYDSGAAAVSQKADHGLNAPGMDGDKSSTSAPSISSVTMTGGLVNVAGTGKPGIKGSWIQQEELR